MKYRISARLDAANLRPYQGGSPASEMIAALVNNLRFELGASAVQLDGDNLTVTIDSGYHWGVEASMVGAGIDAMSTLYQIMKIAHWADFTSVD
jgi:hypothetical protein